MSRALFIYYLFLFLFFDSGMISNEGYCLCSTESCDFIFCTKLDFHTSANKIALFCSLFNRDDPFSVSQNVLRERGK